MNGTNEAAAKPRLKVSKLNLQQAIDNVQSDALLSNKNPKATQK